MYIGWETYHTSAIKMILKIVRKLIKCEKAYLVWKKKIKTIHTVCVGPCEVDGSSCDEFEIPLGPGWLCKIRKKRTLYNK